MACSCFNNRGNSLAADGLNFQAPRLTSKSRGPINSLNLCPKRLELETAVDFYPTKSTHPMTTPEAIHRVAVITGGARGIGLGIGRWFLAQGYRVALLDMDAATLPPVVEGLQALHSEDVLLGVQCDVSDPAQVESAVARVDQAFGRIDALVNNAGIAVFKPIGETTFEEWRSVLSANPVVSHRSSKGSELI